MRSIVRVVSCLLAVGSLVAAADAGAYEVKRTASGLPIHWEKSAVTFEIDPSVARAVPGGYDAVAEALASWSTQEGAPTLTVAAIDEERRPGNDGHNVISFAPDGYAAAGNALAVTVLSYDPNTGAIVDADIVINGKHPFAVLSEDAKPEPGTRPVSNESNEGDQPEHVEGRFDLTHVVAHETGHALGLNDDLNPGPVMYLYTMPNDASSRGPAADDLAGLKVLYAGGSSPTPSAGCSKASIAAPAPDARGALAIALALAGWMTRRRGQSRRTAPTR